MIYLEAFLFTVLLFLLLSTSVSDLNTSKIPNKTIVAYLAAGILAVIPYYAFFAQDCLAAYAVNNVLALLISVILYASGMWGAGDCKLLCAVIFLYPARLYCMNNRSMASCFLLIALVFIAAFLYIIGETLYLGIKQRNLFRFSKVKIHALSYCKSFLVFFLLINLWNVAFLWMAPQIIAQDILLLTAIHFILLLVAMRIEHKISWIIVGAMGAIWIVLLLLGIAHFSLSNINWKLYLVSFLLMIFRSSAEKYNYKIIQVSELKPGMILSLVSIMCFANAKTPGLPTFSTEDLKSRLSAEEVENIQLWSKTKAGQDTLIIVRKIPFALFIAIGTMVFTGLEVLIR